MRERVLREKPICEICRRAPSTVAEHKVPRELGGGDERENYQAACARCANEKTAREDGGAGRPRLTRVTIVCGPPGSGKSTYVEHRRRTGELVVDVDALFGALSGGETYDKPGVLLPFVLAARDAVLERLAKHQRSLGRAWVIAGAPNPKERERLAKRFNAQVVVLEVGAEECLRRIQGDHRRAALVQEWSPIVRDWWRAYQRREGEQIVERHLARTPLHAAPGNPVFSDARRPVDRAAGVSARPRNSKGATSTQRRRPSCPA